MLQKSFLSLAATSLLLASHVAEACVTYSATRWNQGGEPSWGLNAALYDNGVEVCWHEGYVNSGENFPFTCIAADYACIVTPDMTVYYARPGFSGQFAPSQATAPDPSQVTLTASVWGC